MIVPALRIVALLALAAACSSSPEQSALDTSGAAGVGAGGATGADVGSQGLGTGDLSSTALGSAQPGSQQDLEVNVGDRVFFGYDSSTLDDTARQTLDRQAVWLQQFPATAVSVEGHTDERGTREYNLALGERRSAAVRDYLAARGVGGERLQSISYGEERPVDPGHDESAYALNRRAVSSVAVTN